jgi:ketosteroid isomerase-like protein
MARDTGWAMSQENVEIVRRIYTEGLIDRDPKRLVDHFATPDIEYAEPPNDVDPGSRRGRTEVMLALRRARQSFSEYRHELHELFDAGDTVVAAVSFHAKAQRGSNREVIQKEEAHVWTLRDGKIARFENGRNLEAALEAAGLRE